MNSTFQELLTQCKLYSATPSGMNVTLPRMNNLILNKKWLDGMKHVLLHTPAPNKIKVSEC